ncbi:MAG TPA: endonuclease MutS2 [Pseudogracilibacillus sp.]|nr:endonuclease MutS2 [Pseudogracilibacillus sp.]
MNERTLKVLEFHKIVQLLMAKTATSVGRDLASDITPLTDIAAINVLQEETDEALTVLRLDKRVPFAHMEDITPSLKRAAIGSTLETDECLQVAQVIYTGRHVKKFFEGLEDEDEKLDLLQAIVAELVSLHHVEKEIKSKIDDHGDVLDAASPKLRGIRQSIRAHEAKIRERLNHLTRTKSKMLSDAIVTIRNQRYVLPVKHEYRSAIGGIVHDESSSGQTLFMEPKAIIELNNELQQQFVKERQEIEVILQKLTAIIAEHTEVLLENLRILANVDFIFARAHLAEEMKAAKPTLNDRGVIDMKQARHPLIPDDQVVANDVMIGDDYHAIVITGPNTGGKTVTLKMVGLCVLMAQSGLQVPAFDGCELAVFQKVYADIGDEQSIEQNLSTFSSHMTNIVDIMQDVDEETLVLFDELGAGTDPQEGAALAMAILDDVIGRDARVIATTHYPELKAYGYNREQVMNASVEFDVETLRPTYRLLMGVPGRSNAFEISTRLGLQNSIIDHAKSFIGIDSENVENMITALEDTRKEAEKELAEADRLVEESERVRRELQQEWETFQAEREALFKKAEEKAEKALQQAREEAQIIVDEVRQMKDQAGFKEHEWIEARKMLEEAQPHLVETEKETVQETTELEVGDEIKHRTLQQTGEIIEKKGKNEFIIQVGMMKITAKRDDLTFVGKKKQEVEEPVRHVARVMSSGATVKPELDLRGERYEDAMARLEKYIDDALLQSYPRVTIIHGKGTGALRKGVEQFIQTHPHIKSHRLGAHNEGGSGVTVIELS